MSVAHNHEPKCCCERYSCPSCPDHGAHASVDGPGDPWHWSDGAPVDEAELEAAAAPYTEQETTNG